MGYYNQETETAPRDQLEALQWRKLRSLLDTTFARNPFYQRKYASYGVVAQDIRDLGNISKLPFVTKAEFQEDQGEHPPFGTNLSEPLESYVQYHQTTGTTGRPLTWLDTAECWQWRARCVAHALRGAGLTSKDILFLPFNFGPYTAFWGAYEAAQHLGLLTIPGGGWDTMQRIHCLLATGATAVAITPTYAQRIGEVAQEAGLDLRGSKVHAVILGGEPGAMVPTIRARIEDAWGAEVFEYAGLTETGTYAFTCEHSAQTMAIHAIESEFIVEVIDPKTGCAVPEGTIGELVLTNLGRACSPVIRFRTGDLVQLERTVCPCGRTLAALKGGILGRRDDMLLVRGVNVFPSAVGSIVEELLPPGHEYQVVCFTGREGTDDIKVRVETSPEDEELRNALSQRLKERLNLRIEVEAVAVGTMPRSDYKSKRIIRQSH
ncbi:MAG: AMP-binding protein [Chloroflexi bacterium]|nr:AMP-binding protein [Chloroflexota bacterium]